MSSYFCQKSGKIARQNGIKTSLFLIPAGFRTPPQLQQVMRSANKRPFTTARISATTHKSVNAADFFDLSKHRLNGLASQLI